jgi:hypothetical protein
MATCVVILLGLSCRCSSCCCNCWRCSCCWCRGVCACSLLSSPLSCVSRALTLICCTAALAGSKPGSIIPGVWLKHPGEPRGTCCSTAAACSPATAAAAAVVPAAGVCSMPGRLCSVYPAG